MNIASMATTPIQTTHLWLLVLLATASPGAYAAVATPALQPSSLLEPVPVCARPCVESFIDVNYRGAGCGRRPSLRCLCATQGNTDFTLGEGAVQCLVAEARFGVCAESHVAGESWPCWMDIAREANIV